MQGTKEIPAPFRSVSSSMPGPNFVFTGRGTLATTTGRPSPSPSPAKHRGGAARRGRVSNRPLGPPGRQSEASQAPKVSRQDSENITSNIIVAQHDGLKRRKPEPQDAELTDNDSDSDVPVVKRRRIVGASTDATTAVIELSSSSASPASPGPDPDSDARALVVVGNNKSPEPQPERAVELTAYEVWGTPLSGGSELDMSVAPDTSASSSLLRRLGAASVTADADVGMATPPTSIGRAAPRRLFPGGPALGSSAFAGPHPAGYFSPGNAAYPGYGDWYAGDLEEARKLMSMSPYIPSGPDRIRMMLSPADNNSPGPAYVRLGASSSSARADSTRQILGPVASAAPAQVSVVETCGTASPADDCDLMDISAEAETPPAVTLDDDDDDDLFSDKNMSSYTPVAAALSNQSGRSVTSRCNNRPMVAKLVSGQRRNSPHPAGEKFTGQISPVINKLYLSETYRPGNVLVGSIDTSTGASRMKYDMTMKSATTDIVSMEQLAAMQPVLREIAEELGKPYIEVDFDRFDVSLTDFVTIEVGQSSDGSSGKFFIVEGVGCDCCRDMFLIAPGQCGAILHTGSTVMTDEQDKVSSVRGIMREHMPKVVERLKKLGVRIISKSIPADKLEKMFPGKVKHV